MSDARSVHDFYNFTCRRCGLSERDYQFCIPEGVAVERYVSQSRIATNDPVGQLESKPPGQVLMAGGRAASTPIPPFHLIPTAAIEGIANRFAKGVENKGDRCWTAISDNQEVLLNKEFVLERIGHVVRHCLLLRDKIHADDLVGIQQDDDASAVAWGGVFLICAVKAMIDKNENG